MGSFKLEKGTSSNKQVTQAGILLIILSVPVGFLYWSVIGGIMFIVGLLMSLAGKFAS